MTERTPGRPWRPSADSIFKLIEVVRADAPLHARIE